VSCRAGQIADAVVTELNAQSFSQEFTSVRKYRVKYALTALQSLKVAVSPGPASFELLDRRRDDTQYATDVVFLKKIDPDSNTAVDALVELMEEIKDHFRAKGLTAGSTAIFCRSREFINPGDSLVDESLLKDSRTFVGVVRLQWRLRQ
jgi:hypothetical protein